jgi:SAM-dependent methyltransferase
MNWRGKAALMYVFSASPWGGELYYFMQRRVTRSLPSTGEKFAESFQRARDHLRALDRWRTSGFGKARFYEFGAGWDLAIPLAFYVLGVGVQVLVDIRKLLRVELVNETLGKLQRIHSGIDAHRRPERLFDADKGDRWIELLQEWYGIQYRAPCDARDTGLEEASVDFVTSTNTLEHISADNIHLILKECRRLLKKDGLMSFIIDYQDHYSYADKRINAYNFLKYPDAVWGWCNPALHYQNRLRHKDYIEIFEEARFEVLDEHVAHPSDDDLVCLRRMSIAKPFNRNYSIPELGIRRSQVVLRATV